MTDTLYSNDDAVPAVNEAGGWTSADTMLALVAQWRLLLLAPLALGSLALAWSFWVDPTFTAKTTFIPPQQQNATTTALASLGAAAGLAGTAAGLRTPADQYMGLLQSETVGRRIIERFNLLQLYKQGYMVDARKILDTRVVISLAKKEGLISIEVDDHDPQRAADISNAYVTELRRLSGELALTEAQQRRAFFEQQLNQTRDKLTAAQIALQGSGVTSATLKSEPKAAAELYAKLKAEVTAAEVKLQAMRGYLADSATEFQQAALQLSALRTQLAKTEANAPLDVGSADYVSRYREFKYYETLFELFSRQYESARVDESSEGAVIQVVDPAIKPERKSKPKRAYIAVMVTLVSLLILAIYVVARAVWARYVRDPRGVQTRRQLLDALRGR